VKSVGLLAVLAFHFSLNMDTREEPDMSDDKKPDSENQKDDQEPGEAEGGDNGSTDAAAPADDDIIIK
jgi:hypothetical protein